MKSVLSNVVSLLKTKAEVRVSVKAGNSLIYILLLGTVNFVYIGTVAVTSKRQFVVYFFSRIKVFEKVLKVL